jgi:hypothetical protein
LEVSLEEVSGTRLRKFQAFVWAVWKDGQAAN